MRQDNEAHYLSGRWQQQIIDRENPVEERQDTKVWQDNEAWSALGKLRSFLRYLVRLFDCWLD